MSLKNVGLALISAYHHQTQNSVRRNRPLSSTNAGHIVLAHQRELEDIFQ